MLSATGIADAGLAREQDDPAGVAPGLAQAVAQQGTLRRPTRSVSRRRAASSRLSAAATPSTANSQCVDKNISVI
jgi:hypothetical protein